MAVKFPFGRRGLIRALPLPLLLMVLLASCSSAGAYLKGCAVTCDSMCNALAECNLPSGASANCRNDCTADLDDSACPSDRSADQLTCAEIERVNDCVHYCATLCRRAAQCGSFDSQLCAKGCTELAPSVCNPASVAARSCDQLKPELRGDEDSARAHAVGDDIGVRRSTSGAFGLCASASDCSPPLGCSVTTNTCAACATDADCDRGLGKYRCASGGVCAAIDCLSDADCSSVFPVCNQATFKCVSCTSDANCSSSFEKKCDTASNQCVQCVTNTDCNSAAPTCHLDIHACEW